MRRGQPAPTRRRSSRRPGSTSFPFARGKRLPPAAGAFKIARGGRGRKGSAALISVRPDVLGAHDVILGKQAGLGGDGRKHQRCCLRNDLEHGKHGPSTSIRPEALLLSLASEDPVVSLLLRKSGKRRVGAKFVPTRILFALPFGWQDSFPSVYTRRRRSARR